MTSKLETLIDALRREYGAPFLPPAADPFGLILWEQVGYLANDSRRKEAFDRLTEQVGLTPAAILSAPLGALEEIARTGGSIGVGDRAARMQRSARMVAEEWDGDLETALRLPLPKARRVLQRFPMIGAPGADKILLLTRTHAVLALDSNGVRVLLRLGYGREGKSYAATYRSVHEAVTPDCRADFDWLASAHGLLRCHGQRRCTSRAPGCEGCCLRTRCPAARRV